MGNIMIHDHNTRILCAEFNPTGAGNMFLGLRDAELSVKERKFLRMTGLTDKQASHLTASIKHAHDRVPDII